MSKKIDIKVTLPDGTEQLNTAIQGQTLRSKAVPNAKYQVIDAQTGQAPEKLKAKRFGKDLLIQAAGNEALDAEVIIEDFSDVDGSSLVGQGGDGVFYEYIPQASSDTAAAGALTGSDDIVFALGQSPIAASALVGAPLFAPQLAASVLGLGAVGGANLLNTTDVDANADPVLAAITTIKNAAQQDNAGPSNKTRELCNGL